MNTRWIKREHWKDGQKADTERTYYVNEDTIDKWLVIIFCLNKVGKGSWWLILLKKNNRSFYSVSFYDTDT